MVREKVKAKKARLDEDQVKKNCFVSTVFCNVSLCCYLDFVVLVYLFYNKTKFLTSSQVLVWKKRVGMMN